ncbi:hypothetical protein LPB137_10200 [Poseidonibacter parvus]|uniref:SPOR domain-containing protein n=1 Tax=Poseidonibacter parvus TaxID=1850254 RepID=A0A1P8KNL8_9BACT|nr:TolC family protein [Poseidonibacter parvus]APW66192.1 hypothetical protein LPB137_10200 [Poseidonibacter parvus]
MKKQLLSLIILSLCANADNDKLINKDDKNFIIEEKEDKLNELSLFLGEKEIQKKMNPSYPSLNSYSRISDIDVDNYKRVSLMDVVLETVSTSDLLKASREKVIQNEIKLKDAIAGYYPTLNFEYEIGKTRATNTADDRTNAFRYYDDRNYKFVLNQNLYAGGATTNDVENLKKKLDLAKNQYYLVLSEEVTKAIKAYFDVVFSYKTVLTSDSNMKKLNKILDIVSIKYENGAASIGDLTAIKANVSNAKTQQIKVKSKFIESLRYYEYIVGEVYLETLPYEKNFNINVTTFDLLYERALKRNKELRNYYNSIEAEKFNLKSKESNFLPKVDLEFSVDNVMDQDGSETREEAVNGLVKLSYNLYNGGRDKNKVLNSYSSIRELNFKLDEEKRKLKWNVSKLFTAINSTNESLKSNISEVIALRKMVEAYWEEFKLGDQDLQVLLQGQKSLNSAEVELISYEKNNITDFFTLLKYTGDILAFFDIDPEHPRFIDFSKSGYTQDVYIDDKFLDEKERIERQEELEEQEKIKETLISKALKDENIIRFMSKFLSANNEYYTIDIGLFDNILKANNFIKINDFDKEAFSYDVVDDLNINTKVTFGIYKNEEEALKQLEKMKNKDLGKELSLKKIGDVKKLYNDYLKGLEVKIKPVPPEIKIVEKTNTIEKIKQIKKEDKLVLNKEFETKFLNANPEFYTINITSFNEMKELEDILIEKINLYDNSFAYTYVDSKKLFRWVYGIYENYDEAQLAINDLGDIKNNFYPVIQKISKEQALYNANIDLNTEVKEKEPEYEYIKVSSNTVYKDPVSLKNVDISNDKNLKGLVDSLFSKVSNLFTSKEKEEKNTEKEIEKLTLEEETKNLIPQLAKQPEIEIVPEVEIETKNLSSIETLTEIEEIKEEANLFTTVSNFFANSNTKIEETTLSEENTENDEVIEIPTLIQVPKVEHVPLQEAQNNIDNEILNTKKTKAFISENKDLYTINIITFSDTKDDVINSFLNQYDLKYNIKVFTFNSQLTKTKNKNIVYGLYETKEEAEKNLKKINPLLLKDFNCSVEKIGIKSLQVIDDKIIENKIEENIEDSKNKDELKKINQSKEYLEFIAIDKYNDQDFKFEFLNSPKEYYSILLASVNNETELKYFLNIYDLKEDIFVVRLLNNKNKIKIMYKIFENEAEANNILLELPEDILKINLARTEKIYRKQDAYKENYTYFDLAQSNEIK